MAVPVAIIVVVAILGACLVVATGVVVYKIHGNKQRIYVEKEDIEQAEPVRRLRVRHGRVVSTTSTIFSSSNPLVKWPASKFSSRPSSIRTEDLEEDIKAYRQDYPPLPRDDDGNILGIPSDKKRLDPITEVDQPQSPEAVYSPATRSSKQITTPVPMTDIVESSWTTYNGHRKTDDVLSSPIDPLSRLDLDINLSNVQKPRPTKSTSNEALCQSSNTKSRKTSSSRRSSAIDSPTSSVIVRASTFDSAGSPSSPASPKYRSQSKPIRPVAPKPRKPAALNLEKTEAKELDYGFPSPPPSTKLSPSSTTPTFTHLDLPLRSSVSPPSSNSPINNNVYISDIESRPSRGASQCRRSSRSRSSSRSARHRSRENRVRKQRPPPIKTGRTVPTYSETIKSATTVEPDTEPDSAAFLSSPAPSEKSMAPLKPLGRLAGRKYARLSVQTFASSDLSPTFAVSPVLRVPLYAGKATRNSALKMSNNSKPSQKSPRKDRPSILRTQTAPGLDSTTPSWPPSDIRTMLKQAHSLAQSIDPMTPTQSSPKVVLEDQSSTKQHQTPKAKTSTTAKVLSPNTPQRFTPLTQLPTNKTRTTPTAKDDAKRSSRTPKRPSGQARSFSGNLTLSTAQPKAHNECNDANAYTLSPQSISSPIPPSSQVHRRSRYEHLVNGQRRPSLPETNATVASPLQSSVGSALKGGKPMRPTGPVRKASLPARLPQPEVHGPPDPKVLSRILGLAPGSPKAFVDEPSSATSGMHELPGDSPRVVAVPSPSIKNGRGVGFEAVPRHKKTNLAKIQILSGGKENEVNIVTKEVELEHVNKDMWLMSSGIEGTGLRRGAISIKELSA